MNKSLPSQNFGSELPALPPVPVSKYATTPCSLRPVIPVLNATRDASRQRKRSRRGGVKTRLGRRQQDPLPSVVFANVQSLNNKMEELHATCRSPSPRSCRSQCYQPHPSVSTTVKESQVVQGQGSTEDSGCHHAAPGISGLHRLGVFAPDSVNLHEHMCITTDHITFCMDSALLREMGALLLYVMGAVQLFEMGAVQLS